MFKSRWRKAERALMSHQIQSPEKQTSVPKQDYIEDNYHRTYSCIHCRAHLASHDELVSKLFQGNHGRAYLFNKVVNVGCKQAVERELLTGLHAVADIFCNGCETTLGWKYERAFVSSQKYKEGKYIIELVHMLKEENWDMLSYNAPAIMQEPRVQDYLIKRLIRPSSVRRSLCENDCKSSKSALTNQTKNESEVRISNRHLTPMGINGHDNSSNQTIPLEVTPATSSSASSKIGPKKEASITAEDAQENNLTEEIKVLDTKIIMPISDEPEEK